ncbi:hypothetical protein PIB19_10165 [Sphingomonas sp. 7/4-4]|uniref:hypothetical protein n=1 Tax=Sphingomonas sp. 7/4-4 TaxID=3018446 RepID=UPI0022F3B346|nr:hypothetical protein [Sphingomonas sp. 7/4-4]WBY09613.1 hypothetical protein PIB19_10165 [Sphingomonas sp. 7/4-4]
MDGEERVDGVSLMLTRRREGAKKLFAQQRDDATISLCRASGPQASTFAIWREWGGAADAAEQRIFFVASSLRRANQPSSLRASAPSREQL